MNATQALSKARKILGPKARIEVRNSVPVGEARLAEVERRKVLSEKLKELQVARDARLNEILKADAEYQRLKLEVNTVMKERDNLHASYHRRVRIGVDSGIGWHVRAEGDNFDEALADLASKQ